MPPTFSCREIGNAPRSLPRNRQLWFVVLGIALTCTTGKPVFLPNMLLFSKTVGIVGAWRCCRIHPESQISRLSFSACRPWPVEIRYPNIVCHTRSFFHSPLCCRVYLACHFGVFSVRFRLSRFVGTIYCPHAHYIQPAPLLPGLSASILAEIGHLGSELLVEWVTQVLIRAVISSLLLAVPDSYDDRLDGKKDPKVYIR